jgi:ribosomal protein S27AE
MMFSAFGLFFSVPWMLFWTIVDFLFPFITKRACPTCGGSGFIAVKHELYVACGHCEEFGYDRECPECHGTSFVALEEHGDLFEPCPDCKRGTWPRAWAWKMNITPAPSGKYHSELFNRFYSYSID